jgi:glycosyltransferase involved in cell wall biosynthesis
MAASLAENSSYDRAAEPCAAAGPLVTILIPTFNRRQYLPLALASAVQQDYRNIEVIVVNDGGQDVSDIVNSFNDSRVTLINRKENRGKAYSLNEALARAHGEYICYLDDDDLYYPHHVRSLLTALEGQDECGAAYSDLYKVHFRLQPDGSRQVLSKNVEISRDFDRFFMLYFNHVLHVSLMHRRDLLARTGSYNECLRVLIDWDMTRRLCFFSDFIHIHEITGEFYGPVGECDRISVQMRKDRLEYLRNVLTIRATRPPKPWPKLKDLAIVILPEGLDEQFKQLLLFIWQYTFYPYQLYLPLTYAQIGQFSADMPNLIVVPVAGDSLPAQRLDAVLPRCQAEAEFVAVVPGSFKVSSMAVESAVYAITNNSRPDEAIGLEGSTDVSFAAVFRTEQLLSARRRFSSQPLLQSIRSAAITLRQPRPEELPLQFDNLLQQATGAQREGNWADAARLYEYIGQNYCNSLWMKTQAANAYYSAGAHSKAMELSSQVNQQRPTASTLLIEARSHRRKGDFYTAIGLLEKAKHILEGTEAIWTLPGKMPLPPKED